MFFQGEPVIISHCMYRCCNGLYLFYGKDVFAEMRYFREGGCTHFVGMATHDSGGPDVDFNGPLIPGMVIACDTFAVFPEENLGVRIEDTVLITEDGYENLSEGFPREIEEIEAHMKNQCILQMIKEN